MNIRTLLLGRFAALFVTAVITYPADMPVKQVTLYKHGIGFFEREGIAPAGEEMRLDFQNSDMNDVLKSLTVADLGGGKVNAIRYDSNETPEQRLAKFPFQIGSDEMLSAFLDRLKGSGLELKLADKTATGSIIGSRALQTGSGDDKRSLREQVTLLLESGDMANYDLAAVTSMRLLDAHLEEQLQQYLTTLGQSRAKDKRSVYIESQGKDARHLRASYITPTAIWKSSYRLTMNEADSTLEGWAIVDNTTDEDWNDVRLAVVSGWPISFISLLDTPRYGRRQIAELPEDQAVGPVVYSGGFGGGSIGGVVGGIAPPPPALARKSVPEAGLVQQYTILSPKPIERTANAYRFEVKLPANAPQTLKIEQEQTTFNAQALTNYTPDDLLTIVENKQLPESSRTQLKGIADLKRKIAEGESSLTDTKNQLGELGMDQTRLRQNIDSLNRVKGQEDQVRRYSGQLSDNEAQIAKLNDQIHSLTAQQSASNRQLRDTIEKLDF